MAEIDQHRPWSAWERRAHPHSPALVTIRIDNYRLCRDDQGTERWIYDEPPTLGELCGRLCQAVSYADGVRGVVFIGAHRPVTP